MNSYRATRVKRDHLSVESLPMEIGLSGGLRWEQMEAGSFPMRMVYYIFCNHKHIQRMQTHSRRQIDQVALLPQLHVVCGRGVIVHGWSIKTFMVGCLNELFKFHNGIITLWRN